MGFFSSMMKWSTWNRKFWYQTLLEVYDSGIGSLNMLTDTNGSYPWIKSQQTVRSQQLTRFIMIYLKGWCILDFVVNVFDLNNEIRISSLTAIFGHVPTYPSSGSETKSSAVHLLMRAAIRIASFWRSFSGSTIPLHAAAWLPGAFTKLLNFPKGWLAFPCFSYTFSSSFSYRFLFHTDVP